jgi:hypothetical protein
LLRTVRAGTAEYRDCIRKATLRTLKMSKGEKFPPSDIFVKNNCVNISRQDCDIRFKESLGIEAKGESKIKQKNEASLSQAVR